MPRWIRRLLEWLGHFETLQGLAHAEFVRTALWPAVYAVLTGSAGYLGGLPLMWVLMATALAFMAVTQLLLRLDEYRERRTPRNKIAVLGGVAPVSLVPAPLLLPFFAGNRKQRRAQGPQPPPVTPPMLSAASCVPGILRTIDKCQLGVMVKNNASFPISCILQNAETEIATLKPPHSKFPRNPSTIGAGEQHVIVDEVIEMNGLPAGRFAGKLDMLVSYGLPGKEIYELHLTGDVDIGMEDYGLVTQVHISWHG